MPFQPSLHAPLDPTASSSRQALPSTSSPRPSRAAPPASEVLSNVDFYSTYYAAHLADVSRGILGHPAVGKRKAIPSHQDPSCPLPSTVDPQSEWSSDDKNLLFAALARHGKSRSDLIAEEMRGAKSFLEVVSYLHLLESATRALTAPRSRFKQEWRAPRWTRGRAFAAREVSERWIEFEEELAEVLLEQESFQEDEERVKRRKVVVDKLNKKYYTARPVGTQGGRPTVESAKLQAELEKNERGWAREDWSSSLNPIKLEQLGREIEIPYATERFQKKKEVILPPPPALDLPDILASSVKAQLGPDATYEQVQDLVRQRARLREEMGPELKAKKEAWQQEKLEMKERQAELRAEAKSNKRLNSTRLELAKLKVLKRYEQDGLDLFDLQRMGKHLSTLPSVTAARSTSTADAGVAKEDEDSQAISYPTLYELKTHLRAYISNLLQTAVSLREGNEPRYTYVLEEHGQARINTEGDLNGNLITVAAVRKAQGLLGGGRYEVEVEVSGDEDEDEDAKTKPQEQDLVSDSDSEVDDEPHPPRSVDSFRQGSLALSDVSPSDEDPYGLLFCVNLPLYTPLHPLSISTDPETLHPIPSRIQTLHARIAALPHPEQCSATHQRVLTLSTMPLPDVDDLRPTFHRPREADLLVLDNSEEEEGDEEEGDGDEREDEREKRMQKKDQARDRAWEERVWGIVEGMDERGRGWKELGEVMELGDEALLPYDQSDEGLEVDSGTDSWDEDEREEDQDQDLDDDQNQTDGGEKDDSDGGFMQEKEERCGAKEKGDGEEVDDSPMAERLGVDEKEEEGRRHSVSGTPVLGSTESGSDREIDDESRRGRLDEKHEEEERHGTFEIEI